MTADQEKTALWAAHDPVKAALEELEATIGAEVDTEQKPPETVPRSIQLLRDHLVKTTIVTRAGLGEILVKTEEASRQA